MSNTLKWRQTDREWSTIVELSLDRYPDHRRVVGIHVSDSTYASALIHVTPDEARHLARMLLGIADEGDAAIPNAVGKFRPRTPVIPNEEQP